MQKFLKQCLSSCNLMLDASSEMYEKRIIIPTFNSSILESLVEEKIPNHRKLTFDVMKEIQGSKEILALLKTIKNLLKTQIEETCSGGNTRSGINYNKMISDFVLKYMDLHGISYDHTKFKSTISAFTEYVRSDVDSYYCLSPMYNFYGNFENIRLSANLHVRKITSQEYVRIVNVNQDFKDIPDHQLRLKYVLVSRIQHKHHSDLAQIALRDFESVANALKLFGTGNPQFGNIYTFESEIWNVNGLLLLERGHEKPPSPSKYILDDSQASKFSQFYDSLNSMLGDRKPSEFLSSAIRRFGMAFNHRNPADRIIDYVICLESLLVPGIGESTLKLSHRMAALLGKSDTNRLWLWHFAKMAYKFRSGYIHSTTEKPFKVDSEEMDLEDAACRMERYSRDAINRVVILMEKFQNQETLVEELDSSIYDRAKLTKLNEGLKGR